MTAPAVVAAAELSAPTVVLSLAGTSVERGVVDEFARELTGRARPRRGGRAGPRDRCARSRRCGVAWLPPERADGRRFSVRDLRLLSDPSHPGERAQAKLLERAPERCRVVVGEPAAVDELRERWERHSGDDGDGEGFTRFVARQARLAVDRAERDPARRALQDRARHRRGPAGEPRLPRGRRPVRRHRGGDRRGARVPDRAGERPEPLRARHLGTGSKLLWGRAYDLDVDRGGPRAPARAQPALSARLPPEPQVEHGRLRDVVASPTRTASPPTTSSAASTWASGRSARSAAASAWSGSGAASAATRSTSTRCGATSRTSRRSASTSSGTSRAAARARASCCLRGWGCSTTSPRASRRRASRRSCSFPSRSSTTASTSWPRRRRRSAARRSGPEGTRWLLRYARSQSGDLGRVQRALRRARCRCATRSRTATRTRSARSRSRSARASTARRR